MASRGPGRRRRRNESRATTTRTGTRTAAYTETETGTAAAAPGDSVFVVAMIENRAREVGLAAYNLRGLDLELRQFADSMAYTTALTHLTVYDPVEIVLSNSSANGTLHAALNRCSLLADIKISFIARKFFNETSGSLVCDRLSTEIDPRLSASDIPKYLALASAAALKSYVEHVQNTNFAPHCLRIRLKVPDDSLFLDLNLISTLEILHNARAATHAQSSMKKDSLLGVLNHTKTRSGRIFLRRVLLEPPRSTVTIAARQEFISELLGNEALYFELIDVLNQAPDVEAVVSQLVRRQQYGRDQIAKEGPSMKLLRQLLLLRKGVETIEPLVDAASKASNPILSAVTHALRDPAFDELTSAFDTIDPGAVPVQKAESMRLQAAFAVRSGVSSLLDVSRKLLSETIQDMHALTERVKEESGIDKLLLTYNVKRGYHFSAPVSDEEGLEKIDDKPLQLVRQGKSYRFTNTTLIQLNERYIESLAECFIQSDAAVNTVLETVWKNQVITALGKFVDTIALLDCLLSLVTHVTLSEDYVCPRMTKSGPIAIKQGRHPVMETLLERFVPHDTFLSEGSSFHIISGVNMSGKTTYLKSVAILCVLAHTGSWVPAEFASFRVMQQISTRMGTHDSLDENRSSFSQEMSEIANTIHQIDAAPSDSGHLVLVDELGRSTATADGFAIAWAVAEKLAVSKGVLTIFVTHYGPMSQLSSLYPTIRAYHLATETIQGGAELAFGVPQLRMTYQLTQGSGLVPWYGLSTAAQAGFPTEVLRIATTIRSQLSDSLLRPFTIAVTAGELETRKGCHEVYHRLVLLRQAGLDIDRLVPLLTGMQGTLHEVPDPILDDISVATPPSSVLH